MRLVALLVEVKVQVRVTESPLAPWTSAGELTKMADTLDRPWGEGGRERGKVRGGVQEYQ